jgi:hypothetical protein
METYLPIHDTICAWPALTDDWLGHTGISYSTLPDATPGTKSSSKVNKVGKKTILRGDWADILMLRFTGQSSVNNGRATQRHFG